MNVITPTASLHVEPVSNLFSDKSALLIDLDGTLVDSAPDVIASARRMLQAFDLHEQASATNEVMTSYIGDGVNRFIKRCICGQWWGEPGENLFKEAKRVFLADYRENLLEHTTLYPDAAQTIQWLHQQGWNLACVTNKDHDLAEKMLLQLGLYDFFGTVIGGGLASANKPSAAPLQLAADKLEVPLSQCVMIGDSIADAQAARSAKISLVIFTFGYHQRTGLQAMQDSVQLDSWHALRMLIDLPHTVN